MAQAQDDPRFNIFIATEEVKSSTISDQVQQALPILWDRIITQQARPNIPTTSHAISLLRRVRPQKDGSIIQFNPARVWAYLEQEGIPHIRHIPSFNLRIELVNAFGSSMQGSENEVLAYAQQQADALGIQLQPNAPLLAIHIQWLDDIQVQLSTRGQSRLGELNETRSLDIGDPFVQLKTWVLQTLIRARDAYVWQQPQTTNSTSTTASAITTPRIHLTIAQEANLSEQIAIETALAADPRVERLIPTYLNYRSREYLLQLKQSNDSWISDWFAQRGMTATPNAQGWLIH